MLNSFTILGWQIKVSGIRLKAWNKVGFSYINFTNTRSHAIRMEGVFLLFSFRMFIKTFNIRRSIAAVSVEQVQVAAKEVVQKEDQPGDRQKKNTSGVDLIKKVYARVNRLFAALFDMTIKHVDIKKLSLPVKRAGGNGMLMVDDIRLIRDNNKIEFTCGGFSFSVNGVAYGVAAQCRWLGDFEKKEAGGRLQLVVAMDKIKINHPVISTRPVFIEASTANIELMVSNERLEVCQDSEITINGIPVLFQCIHEAQEPDVLKCMVVFVIEGKNFFKSYPFFNDDGLAHIKADGELVLQLSYLHSMSNAAYYFNTEILHNNLHITDAGDFILKNKHISALIQHQPVNNNVCLWDMPPFLSDVVIQAEDPNFYSHNGIDAHYIGLAVAGNFKHKRFKKGASTITMQLCKNLFFHTNKCVSRKVDEMIVAWVLERSLKISKAQILETYLNIIEFAIDVYGIKDAAKYYFNKEVAALTLLECITLTYIIPRPKFFLEALLMRSPKLIYKLGNHIAYQLQKLYKSGKLPAEAVVEGPYVIGFELSAFNNEIIVLTL